LGFPEVGVALLDSTEELRDDAVEELRDDAVEELRDDAVEEPREDAGLLTEERGGLLYFPVLAADGRGRAGGAFAPSRDVDALSIYYIKKYN